MMGFQTCSSSKGRLGMVSQVRCSMVMDGTLS